MKSKRSNESPQTGRVLARVLAEDLKKVMGGVLEKETKSVSCGTNCDEIVTDCWKLQDDSANE